MTAAALSYNMPALPSPFDSGLANAVKPTNTQFANGFTDNVDNITAEAYNYLHNASSAQVWLTQLLGLSMPFNPVAGASVVATPKGGIISLQDSVSGATQFYVALNTRNVGYTDPSLDPTNWALINYTALATLNSYYADAGGTSDAITASYSNVVYPVLVDGFRITVGIASLNATPAPTLQVTLNGSVKTAYTIVKYINNIEYPLCPGDLQGDCDFSFDLPNTKWVLMNAFDSTRPGIVIDWTGSSAPQGYLQCPTAPTNISRTAYAALFAAIGTTWGAGDGSTTFGMPYYPAGYASTHGTTGIGTNNAGTNISHTHTDNGHTHTLNENAQANISGVVGSSYPTMNNNGLTSASQTGYASLQNQGSSINQAAGMTIMKCVKF